MPSTSVRKMIFSADSAAAISPATVSALTLYASPESSAPTLATTGMLASASRSRTSVLTSSTSPTKPRSTSLPAASVCFLGETRSRRPSSPEMPTAVPPCRLMRPTISLLTLPTRTILATSMVASSVTRWPSTNSGSMPSFFMCRLIAGPPPCTTIGLHADEAQQHDVLGELLLEPRRGHRRAAVLEDHGRPPEAADVRHRLEEGPDGLLVPYGHVEYSALRVT